MTRSRKKGSVSMSTDTGSPASNHDLDEVLSDESSFYGDSDEKEHLEELVSTFDPISYWNTTHPRSLSTIQYRALKATARAAAARRPASPPPSSSPTQESAEAPQLTTTDPSTTRQITESIQDFLTRLPPSTTKTSSIGPWIYIYNPDIPAHAGSISSLVSRGTELLRAYETEKTKLEAEHHTASKSKPKARPKTTAALGRKLAPLRRTLEASLFGLARETGVVSGKWMLFPTADHVDEVWAAVAEATGNGELGYAAKVATDDGSGGGRLVAVSTRDYEDKEDVKRVLEKLMEMGLVDDGARPIYYKCDAYTYLEIMSGNTYGLKASLFSSREVLGWKI